MLFRSGNDSYSSYRFIINSTLTVKPIAGLTLRSQLGLGFRFNEKDIFSPTFFIDNLERNERSKIERRHNNSSNWSWNNTATYEKKIKKHSFTFMAGMTMEKYRSRTLQGSRNDLPGEFESLRQIDAATGEMTLNGNTSINTLLSYLFQIGRAHV